jgi:hypothetical protein
LVPNKKKKDSNATVKCFRLVTSDRSTMDGDDEGVIVQPQDDDERDDTDATGE